jgi:hypothetical protein
MAITTRQLDLQGSESADHSHGGSPSRPHPLNKVGCLGVASDLLFESHSDARAQDFEAAIQGELKVAFTTNNGAKFLNGRDMSRQRNTLFDSREPSSPNRVGEFGLTVRNTKLPNIKEVFVPGKGGNTTAHSKLRPKHRWQTPMQNSLD